MNQNTDQAGRRHGIPLLFSLAMVVATVGCANPYDSETGKFNPEYYDEGRHGYVVSETEKVLPVEFTAEGGFAHLEAFDSFVDDFVIRDGGKLIIEVGGADSDGSAAQHLASVAKRARERGVLAHELVVRQAKAGRTAALTLSFDAFDAAVPGCSDWSSYVVSKPKSTPHSNFGCATRGNLAKMLANPGDLIKRRAASAPDPELATKKLRDYRSGEDKSSSDNSNPTTLILSPATDSN